MDDRRTSDPEPMRAGVEAYRARAAEYIELLGSLASLHADDLELIVRHLSITSGSVLDVGCGPGHLTAHLQALGVDAIGIDRVPEFIAHARAAYPQARFELASMDELPVPDGVLAAVLAWYSLIHLHPSELDATLVELRRVLAPGGTLVVGFFAGDHLTDFDHTVATAYYWPIDELSAQLAQAGFTEIERHGRPGIDEPGRRPHGALVATAT